MKTLLLLICLMQITEYAQDKIKFTISIEKEKYLILEEVDLGASIRNISSLPIDLSVPYVGPGSRFQLVLSRNDTIINYHGFNHTPLDRKINLNSEEEIFFLYSDLSFDYGELVSKLVIKSMLPEGNYTIQAKLGFDDLQITSNKISFSVVQPSDSELSVYNLFSSITEDRSTSKDKMLESLFNLYKNNPNSIYAPTILDALRMYYSVIIIDKEKTDNIMNILMNNYPCSHEVIIHYSIQFDKLRSDADKEKYSQNIISKCKDSLISKYFQSIHYYRNGGK